MRRTLNFCFPVLIVAALVAPLAIAQNVFVPATFGGKIVATGGRIHGTALAATADSPRISLGEIKAGQKGGFAIPATVTNTSALQSVAVYMDGAYPYLGSFANSSQGVQGSDVWERDLPVTASGIRHFRFVLTMKNGSTSEQDLDYEVPLCLETKATMLSFTPSGNGGIFHGWVDPTLATKGATVVYTDYRSQALVDGWNPNQTMPQGLFRVEDTRVYPDGRVEAYVSGFGRPVADYGYPAIGYFAIVATMDCGTKTLSASALFRGEQMRVAVPQAPSPKVSLESVGTDSWGNTLIRISVLDSEGRPGRVILHGSGAGIFDNPPPGWPWYWQWPTDWLNIVFGGTYYFQSAPATFIVTLPIPKGFHTTIVASLFVNAGGPNQYDYGSASLEVTGQSPWLFP